MDNTDEVTAIKTDYARNIELFDIRNLTPENIEFMLQVIRDYFKANFPVKADLVDNLLGHMIILDDESFKKALAESGEEVGDVHLTFGFFDKKNNVGYINQDKHKTSGEIFVTMFHECLHAVSIGAGAGFRGEFVFPFDSYSLEQKNAMERGLITLIEGTTHYITLKNVIGRMGFDGTEDMLRYKAERSVMSRIWEAFPEKAMYKAYFVTPIDEIRRYFDMAVAPQDVEELRTNSALTNGQFAVFLVNIGAATEQTRKILESDVEDEAAASKIHSDIMHAVGYFLVYEHRMTGKQFTDEEKRDLRSYLEPYLEELK